MAVRTSTWPVERSSNFLGPEPDTFVGFLARSLALLEREHPEAYARMCAALARRTVLLKVDDEAIELRFGKRRLRLAEPGVGGGQTVRAVTGRATILALVDGRLTLMDSVMQDRFEIFGGLDDLIAFHEGLMFYLHGAVRAPSFPALLRRFRTLETAR